MAGINSWLGPVTGKLKEIASDIITVRTGTVISDNAVLTQTIVTLDNDPDSTQVQSLSLTGPLPAQTRVMMLAYPPRGLVIIGSMSDPLPPLVSGAAEFVFTGNGSFTAAQALPFRSLIIECWAGGGGGGGAAAASASSGGGAGGAGGGYARTVLDVDTAVLPLAVTTGGGGNGGAAGNNAGSAGGTSTVIGNNGAGITHASASGGGGGGGSATGTTPQLIATSAAPGVGTVGDFLAGGQGTQNGFRIAAANAVASTGGSGALGGGGGQSAFGTTAGNVGSIPGGGGAGACSQSATTAAAQAGGNGGAGRVVITGIP